MKAIVKAKGLISYASKVHLIKGQVCVNVLYKIQSLFWQCSFAFIILQNISGGKF